MFKLNKSSEHIILLRLTLIGLLVYKLSTFKLWIITERVFVIVPFSDDILITNSIFHNTLSFSSIMVIGILIFKEFKPLLYVLILLEFLLLATDVMRWQPTVFQFFLSLVIYAISPKYFKSYLLLLLSATYMYSGLHKLNLNFINFNWSKTILVEFIGISSEYTSLKIVKGFGFIIPIIEIFSGLLLLTRFKRKGFFLLIITHLFILLFLTKLSFWYSFAVWSWNVVMLLYAVVYIIKPKSIALKHNSISLIWMAVIFVLPSLNFFESYYPYFSFDMYSGDRHYLYINTPLKENSKLSTYVVDKNYLSEKVTNLAYNELGVPLTHSKWLYRRFIHAMQKEYPKLDPCYEISYYPFYSRESFKVE